MQVAHANGMASYDPHSGNLVGLVAQLIERLNGIQEVDGLIPSGSTKLPSAVSLKPGTLQWDAVNKGSRTNADMHQGNTDVGTKENGVAAKITLRHAIDAVLLAKKIGNCRPRYVNSLRAYLNLFARDRETELIAGFTIEDLEVWFGTRNEAVSTMASNIGRLSALFGFAERRGWIARNPCKQLEKVRQDRQPPKILTPEQARTLLHYCVQNKPNQLAYFTLALLAGIRPEEIERLTWKSVDLEQGLVIVDAAASKVRRRRIVYLQPTALEFMKLAHGANSMLPVKRITRRRYLKQAAELLGFEGWPTDCLRHSAASYLMALMNDAGKVAELLGNSPGILGRHYRAIVGRSDCGEFWALKPRVEPAQRELWPSGFLSR